MRIDGGNDDFSKAMAPVFEQRGQMPVVESEADIIFDDPQPFTSAVGRRIENSKRIGGPGRRLGRKRQLNVRRERPDRISRLFRLPPDGDSRAQAVRCQKLLHGRGNGRQPAQEMLTADLDLLAEKGGLPPGLEQYCLQGSAQRGVIIFAREIACRVVSG
jgi:hypothetical protein